MRGVRIAAGVVTGLLLAACSGGSQLGNAAGELRVTPAELVFERGFAGYPAQAEVRLQNTGRTELTVEVSIEGSFATEAGPYRLPGGADETKTVTFTPGAPGDYTGLVRYVQGERVLEIALSGHAEDAEVCVPRGPCYETWFDPEAGVCRERELPERASCQSGNACIVDGICIEHECRGTALACDDGDACTDDRCDPASGCLHEPVRCPAPSSACQEATCDPDGGCGVRNRADGTACGDNGGCVERLVCVTGQCESRPVPEGTSCNAPCGPGACHDQSCVRPAGDVVDAPGFETAPVEPAREIVFPGLVADDGTVVWFEAARDGSGTTLAALGPSFDGDEPFEERYRDVPLPGVLGRAGAMLAADRVAIALDLPGGGRVIEARHLADGTPAWDAVDMAARLALDPPAPVEVLALVDDGNGAVRVVAAAAGRTAVIPLAADGSAGAIAWLDGTPVAAPETPVAIADADGNLYVTLDAGVAGRRVVSLFGDGSPRWARPAADDEEGPLAVATGLLVVSPGRVRDAVDGRDLFPLPALAAAGLGGPAPAPLLGLAAAYAIRPGAGAAPPALVSIDPVDASVIAARDLAVEGFAGSTSWTAPVLTTRENAVVAVQVRVDDTPTTWHLATELLELRPNGEDARACMVPGLGALAGPPALRNGWFALAERTGAVKLYRLRRGADPATWGWAGPHGGPGGGNREAP